MNQSVAFYGLQAILGTIAAGIGIAELSGIGVLAHVTGPAALGNGLLVSAGCAEILAGLFLLIPRGGALGAVLLASVTVGGLGLAIGHGIRVPDGSANGPSLTTFERQVVEGAMEINAQPSQPSVGGQSI